MWKLLFLSITQCLFLSSGQVLLKYSLPQLGPFSWTCKFLIGVFTNIYFLSTGLCYALGSLLWMYILKHYPFSMASPLVSLCYVFSMLAAIFIFHESVSLQRWLGVLLIMIGCIFVVK